MYTLGWDAILAHVGDSRAYLFRQGELRCLTHDHTLAEQLMRMGLPAADTVRFRSVLTNAFGCGNESVTIESDHLLLEPGDRLMLCSDGLYDMVSDAAIATALAEQPNPQAAAERLRDLALDGGGRDNVTVLVVDFHAH
jgi:protein phosphatase